VSRSLGEHIRRRAEHVGTSSPGGIPDSAALGEQNVTDVDSASGPSSTWARPPRRLEVVVLDYSLGERLTPRESIESGSSSACRSVVMSQDLGHATLEDASRVASRSSAYSGVTLAEPLFSVGSWSVHADALFYDPSADEFLRESTARGLISQARVPSNAPASSATI